jgi:hypothetical protein
MSRVGSDGRERPILPQRSSIAEIVYVLDRYGPAKAQRVADWDADETDDDEPLGGHPDSPTGGPSRGCGTSSGGKSGGGGLGLRDEADGSSTKSVPKRTIVLEAVPSEDRASVLRVKPVSRPRRDDAQQAVNGPFGLADALDHRPGHAYCQNFTDLGQEILGLAVLDRHQLCGVPGRAKVAVRAPAAGVGGMTLLACDKPTVATFVHYGRDDAHGTYQVTDLDQYRKEHAPSYAVSPIDRCGEVHA